MDQKWTTCRFCVRHVCAMFGMFPPMPISSMPFDELGEQRIEVITATVNRRRTFSQNYVSKES